jgi:hypothetical protein
MLLKQFIHVINGYKNFAMILANIFFLLDWLQHG